MFTGTCSKCGQAYEGESLGMVKMAMLFHVSRSSKCSITSPDEIDLMLLNDGTVTFDDF